MKERLFSILKKDSLKIGLVGLGKSNVGVMNFILEKNKNAKFIIYGGVSGGLKIPTGVQTVLAKSPACNECLDAVFFSPSAKRDFEAFPEDKTLLCSDAELFFALAERPILAVSGSDGKSTTVKMAEAILNQGSAAVACGNIGLPFVSALSLPADFYVCEISSFTLEYSRPRTKRALITNITENHLDWHGSYGRYIRAKKNLLCNSDEIILSPDTEPARKILGGLSAFGVFSTDTSYAELCAKYRSRNYFTVEGGFLSVNGEAIMKLSGLSKKEPHNIKNALAAIALTHGLCDTGAVVSALSGFSGLPHRIEDCGDAGGVRFINSSIDSSPMRTAATLRALPRELTVLLGGRGKGLSYEPLIEPLLQKTGKILISGENREQIAKALRTSPELSERIIISETLAESVAIAKRLAHRGETVLLSPASTSYDAYSNFEERGNKFKEYIKTEG